MAVTVPHALRGRSVVICLTISVLLALISVPLIATGVAQVRSMIPQIEPATPREAYEAAYRTIEKERVVFPLRRAMQMLAAGSLPAQAIPSLRRSDPGNGLYAYLEVLALLREAEVEPGADERDAELAVRVRALQAAPPARLHLVRQWKMSRSAFESAGLSSRQAAVQADRIRRGSGSLAEQHRPVLRESADRLITQGDAWREAGRAQDAAAAHGAVVRLLTAIVADSPVPGVALLAGERLPLAFRALARDLGASKGSSSPFPGTDAARRAIIEACEEGANRAAAFRNRWHATASLDRANLLPYTGDVVLAEPEHDRALGSLMMSAASAGAWLTIAAVALTMLVVVGLTRRQADTTSAWQWGGRGAWVCPIIACSPAIAFPMIIPGADPSLAWFMSYPSLPALAVLPGSIVLMIAVASTVCVRFVGDRTGRPSPNAEDRPAGSRSRTGPGRGPQSPLWIMWLAVGVPVAALAVGMFLLPVDEAPWRPPAAVQRLRQLGPIVGIACGLAVLAWIILAIAARRQGAPPIGARARVHLHTAARSLLLMSLLALVLLALNRRYDNRHQEAFARALADPVTDRLGRAWREEHFPDARLVLDAIEGWSR